MWITLWIAVGSRKSHRCDLWIGCGRLVEASKGVRTVPTALFTRRERVVHSGGGVSPQLSTTYPHRGELLRGEAASVKRLLWITTPSVHLRRPRGTPRRRGKPPDRGPGVLWITCGEVVTRDAPTGIRRWMDPRGAPSAAAELRRDLLHLVVQLPFLFHELGDLLRGVHDRRGVAPAEQLADLREREVGALAAQIHGDLSRLGDRLRAAGAVQVLDRELEVGRGRLDDVGRRDDRVLGLVDDVAQHALGELAAHLRAVEARERRDADQGALELADVRRDHRGDVLDDVLGDVDALARRLLAEDRDARLEVGRLHVGDETPLEARAHAILEAREQAGRHVARDHDLLVVVVQRVERVEERLLRLGLALQELDVVDQQNVEVAVAGIERGAAVV